MASQVRFYAGTKQQYMSLLEHNPLALYFCDDTGELFKGDILLTDGVRVVPTKSDLPSFDCAAEGVVYYITDTRAGFMLAPTRDAWLQTIYAPVDDVDSIPEGEEYNVVTTVGAVRDIEKKIYERIDEVASNSVADIKPATRTEDGLMSANDKLIVDSVPQVYVARKYDISDTPVGTIVDYRDHEIRIMCPSGIEFTKQNVGANGNPNMYYMTFKAYAPDGAVSFKEGDQGTIKDEMFTFDGPASGVDEFGRKYSVCWLALASYDESTGTWTYFGKNSSNSKYIGWTYVAEWYNPDGVIIGSDCVRINLSNEACHASIEPFYVADIMKQVDEKLEETAAYWSEY